MTAADHAIACDLRRRGWAVVPLDPRCRVLLTEALAAARAFFARPEPVKRAVAATAATGYRGWEAPGSHGHTAGLIEAKQGYVIGQEPAPGRSDPRVRAVNPWPAGDPGLAPALAAARDRLLAEARALLPVIEVAMGATAGSLDALARDPMLALRVLRYPAVPPDRCPVTGIGAHTDAGCLTLLWQPDAPGLEIEDRAGCWSLLPPDPDLLVLSLGDMAEPLSGGRLRALQHRVITRSPVARHSVAFFLDLDPDAPIAPLPGTAAGIAGSGPVPTAAEMLAKMHERDYR